MTTLTLHEITLEELMDSLREVVKCEVQQLQKTSEEKLLNTREVSTMLKVSMGTVNNWTRAGVLQSHYIGRKKFYRMSEIISKAQTLKKYDQSAACKIPTY
jgi:hypothetical protein